MAKPVSLSVHKSQADRRERKMVRDDMRAAANDIGRDRDVVAFALVAFDRNGTAYAAWETGGIVPLWAFPAMVGRVLEVDCATVEDDYKAPLHRKFLGKAGQ